MALNPIQTLSDAFWAAVLPSLPEKTVYIEDTDRWSPFLKGLYRAPGDHVQVRFEFMSQGKRSSVRTFAQNKTGDTTDYVIAERYVFHIIVKDKSGGAAYVGQIFGLITKALFSAYPHLSVTAFKVTDFQLDQASARNAKGNQLVVPMTILCRPYKSQVVAS
jgi:hypothetical protein